MSIETRKEDAKKVLTEPQGTATHPDTDAHYDIDEAVACLTVAASAVITDWSDITVRGYLKDHPDEVAYRLGLLGGMLAAVRAAVSREQAGGSWSPHDGDPAARHHEMVAQFGAHTCGCEWCVRATADPEATALAEHGLL